MERVSFGERFLDIHDLDAALEERTAPVPAIRPPVTTTMTVDGVPLAATTQEILPQERFVATAGTNCPNDTSNARTLLVLEHRAGGMRCGLDGAAVAPVTRVEITMAGNEGFDVLVEGVRFAVKTLRAQHRRNAKRVLPSKK